MDRLQWADQGAPEESQHPLPSFIEVCLKAGAQKLIDAHLCLDAARHGDPLPIDARTVRDQAESAVVCAMPRDLESVEVRPD